eukprot:NODE_662_length_4925_cov_0.478243.p4 type:complete len:168 gc:universal NODE_662_length_4925_cov_0.478243:2954-2451(-)
MWTKKEMPKLEITREYTAPRDLLFKCWTEIDRMAKWLAPSGSKVEYKRVEIRPGGTTHYSMVKGNNPKMWGKVEYREISAPEKLVYLQSFADENENVVAHPMAPAWPKRMLITIYFTQLQERSKMEFNYEPFEANESEITAFEKTVENVKQGWNMTFDHLDDYLSTA